jgi:hypothetical protein
VTDGEIAVDGKKFHGVIYQGKFHLVEQAKAKPWPLSKALLHKLLGLPAPPSDTKATPAVSTSVSSSSVTSSAVAAEDPDISITAVRLRPYFLCERKQRKPSMWEALTKACLSADAASPSHLRQLLYVRPLSAKSLILPLKTQHPM